MLEEKSWLTMDELLRVLARKGVRLGRQALYKFKRYGLINLTAKRAGRPGRGKSSGSPALYHRATVAEVVEIRRALRQGKTLRQLAEEWRVQRTEVRERDTAVQEFADVLPAPILARWIYEATRGKLHVEVLPDSNYPERHGFATIQIGGVPGDDPTSKSVTLVVLGLTAPEFMPKAFGWFIEWLRAETGKGSVVPLKLLRALWAGIREYRERAADLLEQTHVRLTIWGDVPASVDSLGEALLLLRELPKGEAVIEEVLGQIVGAATKQENDGPVSPI